jgi:HD-GYP domain-containing protein (c-di-GMP phosphodiesterase class II)
MTKGNCTALVGAAIPLPARLTHVAFRAETHRSLQGPAEAVEVVQRRGGGELDRELAAAFAVHARPLLGVTAVPSVWQAFLDAEPLPWVHLRPGQVFEIAEAFARFVDVKSPPTLGHSTGVARLARLAAQEAGLDDAEEVHVAALLHDLGRVSVANGIWNKPEPLNPLEWQRVHLHAWLRSRRIALRAAPRTARRRCWRRGRAR